LFLLALCWLATPRTPARADATADEFFEKEVRPLLADRCLSCHGGGEGKIKGGLRLTSRAGLIRGGDSGPAAVAGQPDDSLLVQAIRYQDEPRMPPKQKLADREVATLVRWVEMGLPWPEVKVRVEGEEAAAAVRTAGPGRIADEARRFWSFQPVGQPATPEVADPSWPRSDIDRFILSALETRGLGPAPTADKRTLIRRATYDLTGLPPTPEEVAAFLADDAPDAFARVVDRLLASPRYGERWGRHWLDVVRYADARDARGIGGAGDITEAWRYRDWVVDAFNRDMPYDRFIIDQLAGDLIPSTDPNPGAINVEGLVATGLLALGEWGPGDADKEKMMTDIVDDQIDVVGRAFLGLTLACARCHDHKFDPIPTADYYGLAGIFLSTHIIPDPGNKTIGSPQLHVPLVDRATMEAAERHKARLAERQAKLKAEIKAAAAVPARDDLPADQIARIVALGEEVQALVKDRPPPIPLALAAQEGGVPKSPHEGFHDARIHVRGSYRRLAETVPRHFPRVLAGDDPPAIPHGSGRRELAQWIARPDHPLTARVMVNRIWQHHFGTGIVRTSSNFGKLGERPTHPELLDTLARQFVASGWSVKAMHRAIMLSATYGQSSTPSEEALRIDPENRGFGRMDRRRLESEEIRDSLLAVAGRLDGTMGGPSTPDFNGPRRSLYQRTVRSDRSSFGPLFDAADSTAIIDRRTVSTVAPQALFLLNNPFVLDVARDLSRRILNEGPTDDRGRIDRAYALLFGRPPTAVEAEIGTRLLAVGGDAAWEAYAHVLLCTNEFLYVD
jgi:hypothetical protein